MKVPGQRYVPGEEPEAEPGEYTPLPEGLYTVAALAAEVRVSRANSASRYLWLELAVQEGRHEGRKVWWLINAWNASEKAASIGRAQLSELLKAIGLPLLEDTDELLGRPFVARLSIEPGDAQYKPSNRVVGCRPTEGQALASRAGSAQPSPASASPAQARGAAELDDDIPF